MERMAAAAAAEIVEVLAQAPDSIDILVSEIERARGGNIMLYGVGREGLMMRALTMRLAHLGFHSSFVGDMAAPRLGHGDLFIASSGPGSFSTVDALVNVAHQALSRVVLLTAQPDRVVNVAAVDALVSLPAATMHSLTGIDRQPSMLPMGSMYEGALFFLFELLVLKLRDELAETDEGMRVRHTNME